MMRPTMSVRHRFLRAHPVVAVGVLRNPLQRLPGLLGDRLVDALARLDDLARLNRDVGRVAAETAGRLVNQEPRIRQRRAVFFRRREIDMRRDRADPAGTHGAHDGLDEADHVVDGIARFDVAARRADEDRDRVASPSYASASSFSTVRCATSLLISPKIVSVRCFSSVFSRKLNCLRCVDRLVGVHAMTGRIHDRLLQ